jgi:hypothetical protein
MAPAGCCPQIRRRQKRGEMNRPEQTTELSHTDGQLVDLVRSALVDPNIHTDTRMHICDQIAELLRPHRSAHEALARARQPHHDELPSVLESVLTDPSIHTDTRARLHREIRDILAARR